MPKPPVEKVTVTVTAAGSVGTMLAYARAQIGKPYVWAAAGPGGFDCSGLVVASFARIGIRLPHQTGGLITRGRAVSRSQLQPGDLVFPSSSHVGIYVGNGMMIHAPKPGDHVKMAKVYAFYAAHRLSFRSEAGVPCCASQHECSCFVHELQCCTSPASLPAHSSRPYGQVMGLVGAMQTRDGRWRVEVGGIGSVSWYRLSGPNFARNLPSLEALLTALAGAGVDPGDLTEVTSDPKLPASA